MVRCLAWIVVVVVLLLLATVAVRPHAQSGLLERIPNAVIKAGQGRTNVPEPPVRPAPLEEPKWPQDDRISEEFVLDLLGWFRAGHQISFELLQKIVSKANHELKKEPNVLDIGVGKNEQLTICGDIHGQLYDLLNIWRMNGNPSPDCRYIFNGDFVDRGQHSLECILSLFAWKALHPEAIFLIRGNHETKYANKLYGFKKQIDDVYSPPPALPQNEPAENDTQSKSRKTRPLNRKVFSLFNHVFCSLPLAALLTGDSQKPKVFVVHGGLPTDEATIDDLNAIDRFRQPDLNKDVLVKYMFDMLWTDPQDADGVGASTRGPWVKQFGPDITERFVVQNDVKLIVRSHETMRGGYGLTHQGRVVTVFSAPNYRRNNLGAFLLFDHNLDAEAVTFASVDACNVPVKDTKSSSSACNTANEHHADGLTNKISGLSIENAEPHDGSEQT